MLDINPMLQKAQRPSSTANARFFFQNTLSHNKFSSSRHSHGDDLPYEWLACSQTAGSCNLAFLLSTDGSLGLNFGVRWQKITIVGVGLLGGSIGLAVRKKRLARRVVGFVRRKTSLVECRQTGAVDEATLDLAEAVAGADLVVLCTPIGQMQPLAEQFAHGLKTGAIVTDVGSVKLPVTQQLEPLIANVGGYFVGSHPMAGSEKTGVRAARAELFNRAVCVVTPTTRSHEPAVRQIEQFWRALGCQTIRLAPAQHDVLVSLTSHLPHVVAAALVRRVLYRNRVKEQALLCAEGFKDTTRIASSSPGLWCDIAIANRRNLTHAIDTFISELRTFRSALVRSDTRAVTKFFQTAKASRDAWCAAREQAKCT